MNRQIKLPESTTMNQIAWFSKLIRLNKIKMPTILLHESLLTEIPMISFSECKIPNIFGFKAKLWK